MGERGMYCTAADGMITKAYAIIDELSNEVAHIEGENRALKIREGELEALLYSLTPGGSEFVGDPERCAAFAAGHGKRAVEAIRKRNEAVACVRELEAQAALDAKVRNAAAGVEANAILEDDDGPEYVVYAVPWHIIESLRAALAAREKATG